MTIVQCEANEPRLGRIVQRLKELFGGPPRSTCEEQQRALEAHERATKEAIDAIMARIPEPRKSAGRQGR